MSNGSVGTASNVTFGSGYPSVILDVRENDTYFQTSDGLYTGTVLAEFVYDSNGGWIQVGSGASGATNWAATSW